MIDRQAVVEIDELKQDFIAAGKKISDIPSEVIAFFESLGLVIDVASGTVVVDLLDDPLRDLERRRIFSEASGYTVRYTPPNTDEMTEIRRNPETGYAGFTVVIKSGSVELWPPFVSLKAAYEEVAAIVLPAMTAREAWRISDLIDSHENGGDISAEIN